MFVADLHNDVVQRAMIGEDINQITQDGHTDLSRLVDSCIDLEVFVVWVSTISSNESYLQEIGSNLKGSLKKIEFMEEGDIIANYIENDSKRSFKLRVLFRDLSIEDRIKLSSSGITVHSLANDKPVVINLSSDEINNQGLVELSNRIFLNLRK